VEVGPSLGDVDECDEEDGHLYGSATDDVPDETLEGHSSASQRCPVPSSRLVAEGGVDCTDGGVCNVAWGGAGERGAQSGCGRDTHL